MCCMIFTPFSIMFVVSIVNKKTRIKVLHAIKEDWNKLNKEKHG